MDFFERLQPVSDRWDVLQHPFYQRWSGGELTREELSFYAGEYRHAVEALAIACEQAANSAAGPLRAELSGHAQEERTHIGLWDEFAGALDADTAREPLPETVECAAAWTAASESIEGLAILYSIESAQPAIAQTKLNGLTDHYGVADGSSAARYFALHAERDHEHAAHSRAVLEEHAADIDADRLLELSEAALRGNWRLLDGVERQFGR